MNVCGDARVALVHDTPRRVWDPTEGGDDPSRIRRLRNMCHLTTLVVVLVRLGQYGVRRWKARVTAGGDARLLSLLLVPLIDDAHVDLGEREAYDVVERAVFVAIG